MASYDGDTVKVTELFSTGLSTANVCLWRLHGWVLDFKHLSGTGLAEIAKSTNLKGCFGHVVYNRGLSKSILINQEFPGLFFCAMVFVYFLSFLCSMY